MPTIRFVKLKKPEKAKHLCLLAEKYFSEGKRVLLTVSDDNQGVTLDRFLWTWSKGAFVPHVYDNGSVECFDEPVRRLSVADPAAVLNRGYRVQGSRSSLPFHTSKNRPGHP